MSQRTRRSKRQRTAGSGASDADEAKSEAAATVGHKWVVPVDGSPHNVKAVEWVMRRVHKEAGDKVFLLCVVEEVHPHLPATDYYNTMRKQINEQLHEKAAAVLKRFSVMLANENIEHETRSITADSAKVAICGFVDEVDGGSLVLARRGLSEGEKMILGSTSDYCVRHAHATVVVVK